MLLRQRTWKNCKCSCNSMTRNRLYLFLFLGLIAGYSYVLWESYVRIFNHPFTPCIFKNITGIACPSCGVTRSVLILLHGGLKSAILMNPLGLVVATIMAITPFWLLYDVLLKKNTLYNSYLKTEKVLKIPLIAILLFLLIAANWAWNIHKGL